MFIIELQKVRKNRILGALPGDVRERMAAQLELVALPAGHVLYESGDQLSHAYFPIDAIASLIYELEDGATSEIAVAGSESVIGISLFMGGHSTPSRAIVIVGGHALRLPRAAMQRAFQQLPGLQLVLLKYTQALLTQMAQTAVCNRHHSVDKQLCRWLLTVLDRLTCNELAITQELISALLGVRREGVTEAAGRLQDAGLISYKRGHITVIDRPGLERRCCECYGVVHQEFQRLLPHSCEPRTVRNVPRRAYPVVTPHVHSGFLPR